ncbi:hypothetical protein TGAM01_v203003 [Trichoderma gamsii]|uniref:CFEM domain-containing protein n=1 Tax=Trichoderma gamsii TaxID=398673 RepID=A0A2P4ZUA6_9HYPO|nr:hypothetical protein TGAM01_v203003 [Trichoderma gamsii]PON27866.1 hypothetical protein TGAM01_v203003 [Trichoderma gamsii]
MKSVVIALCTFAAAAAAQGSPNLAACGQTCATNMLDADKADELGCKQNDLKCLCANKNFLYGLRDCSAAICSAEDARQVVEYGISISAGVAIQTSSGGGNGGASNTGSASGSLVSGASTTVTAVLTDSAAASGKVSTIFSTLTSDGETITTGIATTTVSNLSGGSASSGTGASGQISTIATTVTESDGSVETKTSEVTLSGSATATGTGAHQTESVVLSTVTSDGSAVVKTLTTLHKTTGETESASATETETVTKPESSSSESEATATDTGSSSASTTSTSTGAGVPQKTAGPVGIIAAAGLAMLML